MNIKCHALLFLNLPFRPPSGISKKKVHIQILSCIEPLVSARIHHRKMNKEIYEPGGKNADRFKLKMAHSERIYETEAENLMIF
jgi:hypothetical protein